MKMYRTRSFVAEPVETLAIALLAKVVAVRRDAYEANERVELADAVLKRGAWRSKHGEVSRLSSERDTVEEGAHPTNTSETWP